MRYFCVRKHYRQDGENPHDFEKRMDEELKTLGEYLFSLGINNGVYAAIGGLDEPANVYSAPFVWARIEFCTNDIPASERAEKLLELKLGLTRRGYSYPV